MTIIVQVQELPVTGFIYFGGRFVCYMSGVASCLTDQVGMGLNLDGMYDLFCKNVLYELVKNVAY